MKEDSIAQIQQDIIEEFSAYSDWTEKYQYLMSLAEEMPAMPASGKNEANLIKSCQSQVWLYAELREGKVYYMGDSDSLLVKGLLGLLIRVFSHQDPAQIAKADMNFIHEIGLGKHLSPNRANGLLAMARQLKFYAIAFQAKVQR